MEDVKLLEDDIDQDSLRDDDEDSGDIIDIPGEKELMEEEKGQVNSNNQNYINSKK